MAANLPPVPPVSAFVECLSRGEDDLAFTRSFAQAQLADPDTTARARIVYQRTIEACDILLNENRKALVEAVFAPHRVWGA